MKKMINKVKISNRLVDGKGGSMYSVQVNGEEMSSKIQGLTLEMDALSVPTLVLRMPVDEIEVEVDCETGKKDSWEFIENIARNVGKAFYEQIESVLRKEKHGEVDEK